MPKFAPPPVPLYLLEALKDYPELIQKIQDRLNNVVFNPFPGTEPFDEAIWAVEGVMEPAYIDASAELEATKQTGDAQAIERANQKMLVMLTASSKGRWLDDTLWTYFQNNKAASK